MNTNPKSEKDLVVGLINGDESAFCELYAIYKNRLIYFAMKYVKSKEFAEDIFQDIFTAIWHNRQFINPESSFSGYLFTIMRNRMLSLIRNIDKEQELKSIIMNNAIDADEQTANVIDYIELEQILEIAIQYLTPQQRRVFDMSRKSGLSNKEIAMELDISGYTVQQHISDSLKTIRTFLSKYCGSYSELILLLFLLKL